MLRMGVRSHMITVRCVHDAYHRLSLIDSLCSSCVAMTPVVHRHIFAIHRVPQQQVPAVVQRDGKPVHHGTVERAYDKLRAIVQMYVLHRQEDRILVWPLRVPFRSIRHHIHDIHTTTCCVGPTLHIHATPVAHDQLCMCRSGYQVWRCLAVGP